MKVEVNAAKFINFPGVDEVAFIDEEARLPIDVLNYSTIQDNSFELTANKIYTLGTRDELVVTFLAPSDPTKGAIFNCTFTAGSTFVAPIFYRDGTLSPISIDKGTVEFIPGTKYEVSYNWASEILIVQ